MSALGGLLTWASAWFRPVAQLGWGAIVLTGAGAACVVMISIAILLMSWRYFRPHPSFPPPLDSEGSASIGRFGRLCYSRKIHDGDPDHGGRVLLIEAAIPFTFSRRLDGVAIRVIMTVRRPKTTAEEKIVEDFQWFVDLPKDKRLWYPDEVINIPVAYISTDIDNHGYRGDFCAYPRISSGYHYLFRVEILLDDTSISRRIYIGVPFHRNTSSVIDQNTYFGDLFYALDENNLPFEDGTFDVSINKRMCDQHHFMMPGYGTKAHGVRES